MDHDIAIDHLTRLIQINRDAEAGLRTAATEVKNSELETLFTGYAKQHARFEAELREDLERLGGHLSDSEPMGGSLRRGWNDLKAALSGHSAGALLSSCEGGEESAEVAYSEAIKDVRTGQTHTLLEKHLDQVKAFRTRLARLAKETKDGVDFHKNEPS